MTGAATRSSAREPGVRALGWLGLAWLGVAPTGEAEAIRERRLRRRGGPGHRCPQGTGCHVGRPSSGSRHGDTRG